MTPTLDDDETNNNQVRGTQTVKLSNDTVINVVPKGCVKVVVKDSGAGMSKDQLSKLFNEGQQFNPNTLQVCFKQQLLFRSTSLYCYISLTHKGFYIKLMNSRRDRAGTFQTTIIILLYFSLLRYLSNSQMDLYKNNFLADLAFISPRGLSSNTKEI